MSATLLPRVIVVTRPTELELLVREHGTREQARFATAELGRSFDELVERERLQRDAAATVLAAVPQSWRRARIERDDLAGFAFDPEDVVVAVGQDGLVANVAKYLREQIVVGINPDRHSYEGVLVRHAPNEADELVRLAAAGRLACEERTMAEVVLDDGQSLRALNEVFLGHRSHQSARYRLSVDGREERQSSSGIIAATGTGCTGWARSIARERSAAPEPPAPGERRLVLYVREAFPAPGFGIGLTAATFGQGGVSVVSEMGEGGVVFGDGIEPDNLRFGWGRRAEIRLAAQPLRLAA